MFRDFLRMAGGRCSVLEDEPRLLWMLASEWDYQLGSEVSRISSDLPGFGGPTTYDSLTPAQLSGDVCIDSS